MQRSLLPRHRPAFTTGNRFYHRAMFHTLRKHPCGTLITNNSYRTIHVVFPSEVHGATAHSMMSARTNSLPINVNMQGRMYQSHQMPPAAAGFPSALTPQNAYRQVLSPLLPPPGVLIPRPDYAHGQYDESSFSMTLHQIHLRSPVRTSRLLNNKRESQERHYQFINGFAVAPVVIRSDSRCTTELTFDVDDETLSRLSKPVSQQDGEPKVPVCEYEDGTLRMRLRCCNIGGPTADMSQSKWVNTESSWPAHIFIMLNGKTALTPKRKPHYGKDLPAELTSYVIGGKNQVKIALAMLRAPVEYYAIAVEIIITKSHSFFWNQIRNDQVIPPEKTLEVIRKRISVNNDDDDDSIMVVTEELPIDLADPFSAIMFETPVRGATCTHLECFDLSNWLETRERKPQSRKCISHQADVCEATCRWRIFEPTLVDRWRCPIKSCFGDARPCSLVVDGFLLGVRKELESTGRLNARSIRVSADGSWKPVPDRNDDVNDVNDDSGSDGDCKAKAAPSRRSKSKPARATFTSSMYPDVRALHPLLTDLT
ncbi:hypothetical protein GGTG_14340 [Gaeumannomyces tritici R3-111a-1]|uniref:Uncharacterized protein n=2 Tax=Gaeumannomyces tritici (strain R3-111a-1) TaxID=644352 RepID=J3PL90_GAET3|nr:hypothetical protein GGTG_14340 [Gaeumannomyces tritici R3-111a-1]EJT68081.1 hypothetical protein GGTG_14340 [Gaeumannomyces tritici R3-111a-1]